MHILIVDDDVLWRQVLVRLLRSVGIRTVSQAEDGQAALALLEGVHPNLIITDFHMPRLDGIGLVRSLRARGDGVPVIMLSGQGDQQVIVAATKAGVNNYLRKPIHVDLLLEKIWQTLGSDRLTASA